MQKCLKQRKPNAQQQQQQSVTSVSVNVAPNEALNVSPAQLIAAANR